ncbi:MAG: hypothetical protein WKF84_24100 [Pyrinomonadaceae bacterium]
MAIDRISVRGARQHNLKNINVEIPRNRLTVVTGLSGSGKSSLAFDTIYAEGQRRYVESLSAYARQFLDQLERPDVDSVDGLSPAISIEQKTVARSPRSTVGTVTEVYDYLRLLFSSIGQPHCQNCGAPITRQSVEQIVQNVLSLPVGERVMVLAPVVRGRKGEFRKELEKLAKDGFLRARIDGELVSLDDEIKKLDKRRNHTIEVVVDRLLIKNGIAERLQESVRTALKLTSGAVLVAVVDGEEKLYSERMACVNCGISVPPLEPRSFSFNSAYGACKRCHGLGTILEIDPVKIVPDPTELANKVAFMGPVDKQGSAYTEKRACGRDRTLRRTASRSKLRQFAPASARCLFLRPHYAADISTRVLYVSRGLEGRGALSARATKRSSLGESSRGCRRIGFPLSFVPTVKANDFSRNRWPCASAV